MAATPKQVHLAKELSHSAPLINCRFDPSGKFLFVHRESELLIVHDFLVPAPDTVAVGGPRKKGFQSPSTPVSNSVSG